MAVITASLGAYAVRSFAMLGHLTDQAINGAFLSIGHARSASASFIALEAAVARYSVLPDQAGRQPQIDDLSRTLDEHLASIVQHAFTLPAAQAAASAGVAIAGWRAGSLIITGTAESSRMDALARIASRRLERLIDRSAVDGLQFQDRARAKAADVEFQTLLYTGAAIILVGVIATLLVRHIMGLIGNLPAVSLPYGDEAARSASSNVGADELGALLMSMGTMRANTVAMTALEILQRRRDGSIPVDARWPR